MSLPKNWNVLKEELEEIIYVHLCNYTQICPAQKQQILFNYLSMYIQLLKIPLNSRDNSALYTALIQIRNHLCIRLFFGSAKQYYLYILDFIEYLQKVNYISNSFSPPKKIVNKAEYESLKSTPLLIEILEKIETYNNSQKLELLTKKHCTPELDIQIKKYMNTLNKADLRIFRICATSFFDSIESVDEWNKSRAYIENFLTKYNIELNLRPPKNNPTSRSLYLSLHSFFSYLIESGKIPREINLPVYQPRNKSLFSEKLAEKNFIKINKSINKIESHLNSESFQIIKNEISNLSSTRFKIDVSNDLVKYIELIKSPINNHNYNLLCNEFNTISCHISKNYVFQGAKDRINTLAIIIEKALIEKITLPRLITELNYNELRNNQLSELAIQKIAVKLSSEEALNEALDKYCSTQVSKRLLDFVNSYKLKERKSYRKPLTDFLNQFSDRTKEWEKNPKKIQSELINYRDNLLTIVDRSTAYQRYNNLTNALKVLIEHGLLDSSTYIPKNIKESSNVEKYSINPLILQVDLRDEKNHQHFSSSQTFINYIQSSLFSNLNCLVKVSREIIAKGYAKYLSKDEIISRSKYIKKFSQDNVFDIKSFNIHSTENKVAYFNYFFDELIRNKKPHNIENLKFNTDIFEYFGLTPLISSAMQIVITEELGFNPHSLYEATISSAHRGEVFILVNDEGSVRVKVYKKRAKHIRQVSVKGSNKPLNHLQPEEIDAATCFKMALEMSERTRKSLNSEYLWTCLLLGFPAALPSSSTFQGAFNKIRHLAYEKSDSVELKVATLKKVRSSKGVLIYLESKGDTLKATNYFGNQVKTALKSYIPKYLSELIYRIKIRTFQNILLYMSVSAHDSPFDTLNLTKESYIVRLKQAFKTPDMGGPLFSKLTIQSTMSKETSPTYFCLSHENIISALKYIKEGTDDQLKADCEAVIRKLSEGSTHLKEMLRKAHKALKG